MKLSKGFIMHDDGEDKLLVPIGSAEFSGLVRGNETAGFIINALMKDTTVDNIVQGIMKKYDAPENVVRSDVEKIIAQLRKIGAVID